jgi:hypothetical protein
MFPVHIPMYTVPKPPHSPAGSSVDVRTAARPPGMHVHATRGYRLQWVFAELLIWDFGRTPNKLFARPSSAGRDFPSCENDVGDIVSWTRPRKKHNFPTPASLYARSLYNVYERLLVSASWLVGHIIGHQVSPQHEPPFGSLRLRVRHLLPPHHPGPDPGISRDPSSSM